MKNAILIAVIYSTLWGCGSEREVEPKAPSPLPTSTPAPGSVTFAEVQSITKASCSRCHAADGFLDSEAAWRSSAAKTRAANGSMPPAGTPEARNLSAENRSKLASF